MRRIVLVLASLAVMAGSLVLLPARAAHATWVSSNCFINNTDDSHVRRKDARAYAWVAVGEGYQWGGGCWNDNDRDDTPNMDPGGEGPDCSGLTFKSWELRGTFGASGWRWWDKFQDGHGPYNSDSFHAPQSGWPFFKLADKKRTTTVYMDAFAKSGHVALLDTRAAPSDSTDYVLEATGGNPPVGQNIEAYRGNSDYVAVRREGWTADCYPGCQVAGSEAIVMVP